MTRILVVDDEEDLREILRFNLEAEGFEVETAASAEEALVAVSCQQSTINLILLDVMMDRMSGFEMAEVLRRRGDQTPIIFLTARDAHDDQLQGFGVGADDYITKPFSFDTVLARVKAVLRRSSQNNQSNQNAPITLTKREHLILQLFQEHPGQFFSRDEILKAVWPDDAYVGERSVDVHIARLRKKLGAEGQRIVNKTGFGYGLV
jgi:DNA-binding response OmpR family regulator